jgi:hypothetical protein
MSDSPSATAHPAPVDWEAFASLQQRTLSEKRAFKLDCIDRGLDRLLAEPIRATSGYILAKRLERDAKKHLKRQRSHEVLTNTLEATASQAAPTSDDLEEIGRAVETVLLGVNGLEHRQRCALAARVLDHFPDGFDAKMGVKARQGRNLANTARSNLRDQPELQAAFFVLRDGFDRWRHPTSELASTLAKGWVLSA